MSVHTRLLACLLTAGCLGLWTPLRAAEPFACLACPSPKFLDGRLTDWTEPHLLLDQSAWRPEADAHPVYGGPLDCSASLRLAWDATNLYVGAVVTDDHFRPEKTGPLDAGDAVVLRIAPATAPAGEASVPVELVFGMPGVATACFRDPAGVLTPATGVKVGIGRTVQRAPETPLPGEEGKPPSTTITKLWYELAIPWKALPHITPSAGQVFGLEMQVLDADGQGLRGRLKWRGQPGLPRTATDLGQVELRPRP